MLRVNFTFGFHFGFFQFLFYQITVVKVFIPSRFFIDAHKLVSIITSAFVPIRNFTTLCPMIEAKIQLLCFQITFALLQSGDHSLQSKFEIRELKEHF
jgi:hypothetical protein